MTAEFEEAFKALKAIFVARTIDGIVLNDEPAKYYVATTFHKVQDKLYVGGKPIWLGGVEIKKNYVTLHFMPFYVQPKMLEGMSAELKKRMHGKACFNFKKVEPELFAEMDCMIKRGVESFGQDPLVS